MPQPLSRKVRPKPRSKIITASKPVDATDRTVPARPDQLAKSPQGKTGTRRKSGVIPWAKVRQDYVEGIIAKDETTRKETVWYPTHVQLAERYGIHAQQISNRSAKERWTELRRQYEIRAMMEHQAKRARRVADQADDFDDKAIQVAERGLGMVTIRMGEIAKEMEARKALREAALSMLSSGSIPKKEMLYSGVNYRELEGLANAAARFQEMGMKALGTNVDRTAIVGPDGGVIDPTRATLDIKAELVRDDAERASSLIAAMIDAKMLPSEIVDQLLIEAPKSDGPPVEPDDSDVIDAEVIEQVAGEIEDIAENIDKKNNNRQGDAA